MAKERLHNLAQTSATFQVRGIVTGMKKEKAYQSGTTHSGGQWNSIEFGLTIDNNKTVFVKLRGFPRNEVFYYKRGEKKGDKGTTVKVAWKDRFKSPGEGFRLIGVNCSVGKDENGKNVNQMFTEYDAVEYLRKTLTDGDSLFVKGNMEFSSYEGKDNQVHRKIELNPTQVSYTNEPIDFNAEGFTPMAEFENTLVFSSINKDEDENGKATGKFILSGYYIGYNTVEPVSFIINATEAKLATNLKKAMKPGYSIKTYGRIDVINDISTVDDEDDGWGKTSPMERANSSTKREYVVYKAVRDSIDTETYNEDDIAKAMKKIKQAKEASEKFADKDETVASTDSDWDDDDDFDDGSEPW